VVEMVKVARAEATRAAGKEHSKGARGSLWYLWMVFALRRFAVPRGFKPQEHNGIPTVVNEDGIAISVSSGDRNTGTPIPPTSRNPKGPETARAIKRNRFQLSLMETSDLELDDSWLALVEDDEDEEEDQEEEYIAPKETWSLIYHEDRRKKEIRFELSKAVNMTVSGYVKVTQESPRIVFDPLSNAPPKVGGPEEEKPATVEVRRKKG
jgi:hypothetical protein